MPRGTLLERITADEAIPKLVRELFALHGEEYAQIQREIERVDEKLIAGTEATDVARD